MNYGFAAEAEDESTDNKEIAVPVIDAAQTTNSQVWSYN